MTDLPTTMTAIEIATPGGPEVLRPTSRPVPAPGPGEILVKVAVAGVNRPDVIQRKGLYPPPPGASDIPGLEIAGIVAAIGEGVVRFRPGERVCALVSGGGYAEYCLAPEGQALPVPAGLDDIAAAAIPENWFTVWSNLIDRGRLAAGETILIHGGSSGIGTAAIQLAVWRGARVIVTAGSVEKCQACLALGAERAINYKTEDFVQVVKEATGGKGVNVVLDMVGGDYIAKNIGLLAEDGRLVFIAFLNGPQAQVNFQAVMVRRLTITGSTLRPRPIGFKAAIAGALQREIWPALADGRIKPVIDSVLPLADAAEAHRRMEASNHIGKILLKI